MHAPAARRARRRKQELPNRTLCTSRQARGQGHTTRLLQAALAEVGEAPCRINAQTYLVEMYAKHGFKADGEEFIEDGIPHTPMRRGGGEPFVAVS